MIVYVLQSSANISNIAAIVSDPALAEELVVVPDKIETFKNNNKNPANGEIMQTWSSEMLGCQIFLTAYFVLEPRKKA